MGIDEATALDLLGDLVGGAGDDAAVVDDTVVTTDMLHETTDFPDGTTRYTQGWRSIGASLSDVAAMGANARAAVAAYGAPSFDENELRAFVAGASDVCEAVGARYVGGDLDTHQEFTVATTALGWADDPVRRDGATPGEAVCVTGTLGRSGAALRLFERGDHDRANDLFRFEPRVAAGQALADGATAMMDSSDGLARSLHQIATASDCGVAIEFDALPIDDAVDDVADSAADRRELGCHFGEDFELIATVPHDALDAVRSASPTPITAIGETTDADESSGSTVRMDEDELPNRGYTHGDG